MRGFLLPWLPPPSGAPLPKGSSPFSPIKMRFFQKLPFSPQHSGLGTPCDSPRFSVEFPPPPLAPSQMGKESFSLEMISFPPLLSGSPFSRDRAARPPCPASFFPFFCLSPCYETLLFSRGVLLLSDPIWEQRSPSTYENPVMHIKPFLRKRGPFFSQACWRLHAPRSPPDGFESRGGFFVEVFLPDEFARGAFF